MTELPDGSRLSFGGEEFVFVELTEHMSLSGALRIQAITDALAELDIDGIIDICPSNASYLLRLDPDRCDPRTLREPILDLHRRFVDTTDVVLSTEILEVPVFYNDPWSTETAMRFRDRHQSSSETDLEYISRVNGFGSIEDFVSAHSGNPFIVTFMCFVPGNAESMQLVPDEMQLQAPKYVRPRTDTPERALGHGGAFATIYPARGAGGYQLVGRAATPVFDLAQELPDFTDDPVLAKAGMIVKYRPIGHDEYVAIRDEVEQRTYRYRRAPVEFGLANFFEDPLSYNTSLLGELADV
ncbi:carboxyltransferase domain-containing protein [Mycobacterium sp. 21AC1]|uniref:5-oxoprolinase subunit B family protein n=1 Tax=[Mycobacterium] appelbergii TaxID=2939269 RepID=UPI002938F080|nr:carboxyltransferase domain-containing protein [Mycobacterium sp. 21AC1]MDV3130263.1 carboxyltransferase domain-containing protein [Mycobacterium sp. 21AC1]